MTPLHRKLLDQAVDASESLAEPLRGRTVVVTGASGFMAANLIAFLSRLDERFQLDLRLIVNARRSLDQVPLFRYLALIPRVEWQVKPVEEVRLPEIRGLIVVHTASYGSPKDYLRHPVETFETNAIGLKNLFDQAGAASAGAVVYFSTAEVYGQPPDSAIPTPEEYCGGLDTLQVRTIYSESKRMAEVLGACSSERWTVPFIALRPWNVYGPGQRLNDGRVPVDFMRQALETGAIHLQSNGAPRRAFCYVWDAMRQITAALACPGPLAAFNIGNGSEETSILELARLCAMQCGLPESAVSYDPLARSAGLQRCVPNTAKVLRLFPDPFEFSPLPRGLECLADWCRFLRS